MNKIRDINSCYKLPKLKRKLWHSGLMIDIFVYKQIVLNLGLILAISSEGFDAFYELTLLLKSDLHYDVLAATNIDNRYV